AMNLHATRRHFVLQALWGAALVLFGALPAYARREWALLPPRPVGWTMKPLSSAGTEERVLPNGQIVLRIQHELLRGVTPAMLVWWWRNIEGEMELGGERYPRYLIWHPIDHIHFSVLDRHAGEEVGVGSVFHIVEALGADMTNLVDAALHLRRLDEAGAMVEVYALGLTVLRIEGEFSPAPDGTRIVSTMTIGPDL